MNDNNNPPVSSRVHRSRLASGGAAIINESIHNVLYVEILTFHRNLSNNKENVQGNDGRMSPLLGGDIPQVPYSARERPIINKKTVLPLAAKAVAAQRQFRLKEHMNY
jgi:hypothetical protein